MIIEKYGNHPSFVMMAYGNEPAGTFQNKFLTEFVSYWKEHDPRRIYTSGAGWPRLAVNDYHNVPQPRIQGWGEQLRSIINAQPPSSAYDWSGRIPSQENPESFTDRIIPVVSHEIGQWCVYPNLKETVKYTGVLKAKNFEIFEESLAAHGLSHLADSFLIASGKLQALCYKADIEAALRTPRFGGFQLLDLHDFPGQGTALVGILDPFWEEKGYITPEEFREFCNTTVPLARLEKHVFVEGETMEVPVQIAHYYRTKDLRPKTQIRLKNQDGEVISLETLSEGAVKIGNENFVGTFSHQFEETGKARQLELEVSYGDFTNQWDLWVYPTYQATNPPSHQPTKLPGNQATKPPGNQPTKPPGNQPTKPPGNQATNPLIVSDLSDETLEFLNAGGSVLLSLGKGKVSAEMGGQVGVGFSSIFWNTAWTGGQKPHTLGILCNPEHPALAQFPTEFHSNWQWWDAMSEADAIYLENFDQPFQPIVRIIDDWVSNRSLALIFEAKVGQGKIVISGADLHSNLIDRPAARQLLTSLEAYMTTSNFDPESSLSIEELHGILKSVDE